MLQPRPTFWRLPHEWTVLHTVHALPGPAVGDLGDDCLQSSGWPTGGFFGDEAQVLRAQVGVFHSCGARGPCMPSRPVSHRRGARFHCSRSSSQDEAPSTSCAAGRYSRTSFLDISKRKNRWLTPRVIVPARERFVDILGFTEILPIPSNHSHGIRASASATFASTVDHTGRRAAQARCRPAAASTEHRCAQRGIRVENGPELLVPRIGRISTRISLSSSAKYPSKPACRAALDKQVAPGRGSATRWAAYRTPQLIDLVRRQLLRDSGRHARVLRAPDG